MKRNFWWIFLTGILGILFFLILVGVLNIVAGNVNDAIFNAIVGFLNSNLLIILLISIVLLVGSLFEIFLFPFNTLYPIFNAIGGILWVELIYRSLKFISLFIKQNVYEMVLPFYPVAIILVVLIVLIVGYANIFARMSRKQKMIKKRQRKRDLEWQDVGEEFKGAAYNLATNIRDSLEPKHPPKKRARKRVRKK